MVDAKGRPYFLWDEDITLEVFRSRLADPDPEVRAYYLGKLMRQAKPDDVFTFATLRDIRELFRSAVSPQRRDGPSLRSKHSSKFANVWWSA
jgi:hypothetical protein